MKEFIAKNFTSLVILVLVIIILLQRCNTKTDDISLPKRDTIVTVINHYYIDTVKTQPQIINKIPPTKIDIPVFMLPDTNYQKLKYQYDSLLNSHYTKNIQQDSIKIDSFGYVKTEDTVFNNKITGRKWISNLIIPEKTTTITIHEPYKPKTQVYLGGGLGTSKNHPITAFSVEGLLKNKKDQIYGIETEYLPGYGFVYKGKLFWKIKF